MGITRLANVTGLDSIGIPVVMACRPNARSLAVSQGKGWDLDAAKASAVMEAIEAYHAENIRLPLKLSSYAELQAVHNVVDVSLLPRVPGGRFHANQPMLWIEGDDYLQSGKIWVPFQIVHTAYTTAMRFDLSTFLATSNGLASGNHPMEAASHAICEVVERDAHYKFSRLPDSDRELRRINLATVDHPQSRELLSLCDQAGVAVAVWDMTSAVGLAAFSCHIVEREEDPIRRLLPAAGAGCHPVRHIAFQRALTEAVQSRLTAIAGSRDDMARGEYRHWRDPVNLEKHRAIASLAGPRNFSEIPTFEAASLDEDLAWELSLIRRAGYNRVIAVDLTRAEFGIPVVRVIVPGMQCASDREPMETHG